MIETAGDRFRAVVARIQFRGWQFHIGAHGAIEGATAATYYLQIAFDAEDFGSPEKRATPQTGRRWMLSRHMTDGEIVQTALMAVLAALEHEVREEFTYRGHAIFGPHYDLEVLVAVCETKHNDVRRAPVGDAETWLRGKDHDQLLEDVEPSDPFRRER